MKPFRIIEDIIIHELEAEVKVMTFAYNKLLKEHNLLIDSINSKLDEVKA